MTASLRPHVPECERSSEQPALREGHAPIAPDNEVIEHAHIHQRQCIAQPLGDEFVGLAGLGHAGRVLGCISGCNRPFCLWV